MAKESHEQEIKNLTEELQKEKDDYKNLKNDVITYLF